MTHTTAMNVRPGWKVYSGSEQIGEIDSIRDDHVIVRKGTLIRHFYALPMSMIDQASDGIVDLNVDREAVERLELDGGPSDAHTADELPKEYRQVELRDKAPNERSDLDDLWPPLIRS